MEVDSIVKEIDSIISILLILLGICLGLVISAVIHELYIYPKFCEYLNSTYLTTLNSFYCVKNGLLVKVI